MLERLLSIPRRFYTADEKRLSFLAYAFLTLLCVAFFTPGLATMPPTDRDESLFAQASKQMIESGNYTDIRVQTEPRYKKPIGIYWLQSSAARLFNPHHLNEIWAYRLPSFIGATIAVLMTAGLGALLFNPATGLLAAMMLSGCVLLNVEARLATTDASLLACIMGAMYGLAKAYVVNREQGTGNSEKTLLPVPRSLFLVPFFFWTALAAGILLKGPIILLPLCGTLLWLKLSDKNIGWFQTLRPLPGLLYMLALVTPWFIAISMQSHGAFMQASAGNDMLAKIWQGQNRGRLWPGTHLLVFMPLCFFPFALLVLFALPDIWKNRRDDAVKFCLGWIIPTWILFELSFTKLPHYVLPTYPAIALLTAKCLCDGFPTLANAKRRLPLALMIAMWLMIGAGFAAAFALLPGFSDGLYLWPQIGAGALLILAQGAALLLLPKNKPASIAALTIGMLLFLGATFGDTLPKLQHIWVSREITQAAANAKTCPTSQIISLGYHEPSLVFLVGTDTILASDANTAAAALKADPCRTAVIDIKHQQEFLDAFASDQRKPQEAATIEGLNSGHGAKAALTLFTMAPP